jgi:hypothetical protein
MDVSASAPALQHSTWAEEMTATFGTSQLGGLLR